MDISSQSKYALTERISAFVCVSRITERQDRGALDNHENRNHAQSSLPMRNASRRSGNPLRALSRICQGVCCGSRRADSSQDGSETTVTTTVDRIRTLLVCSDKDLFAVQCYLTNLDKDGKEEIRLDRAQNRIDNIRRALDIIQERISR